MANTYELTVDIQDFGLNALEGVDVTIGLNDNGVTTDGIMLRNQLSKKTDATGIVKFDLVPTREIAGDALYVAQIGDPFEDDIDKPEPEVQQFVFVMPDQDINLATIIAANLESPERDTVTVITQGGGGTGTVGPRGPIGPQGPQGIQGPAGRDGTNGRDGERGADGAKGDKGDKGDTGDTGAAGAKGDKGDPGEQGPRGAAGVGTPPRLIAGSSGVYLLSTTENLIMVELAIPGERVISQQIVRSDLTATPKKYVFDTRNPANANSDGDGTMFGIQASINGNNLTLAKGNFQGTLSAVYGMVSGSQGPEGVQGPQGTPGAAGAKGDRGEKGDKGDTGERGAAGADSTVPGPQGIQGPKGDKGDQGERGEQGPEGQGSNDIVLQNDADASTVNKIGLDDRARAYTTRQIDHPTVPNTFVPVEYSGDGSDANYLGVLEATPSPSTYMVGQWFVHGFLGQPRIVTRVSGTLIWTDVSWATLRLDYIGAYPRGTVAEVAPHASANGQVFLDVDDNVLRQVTNFVAGRPGGPTQYDKLQLADDEDLEGIASKFIAIERVDEDQSEKISTLEQADRDIGERIDGVVTTADNALDRTNRVRPIGIWERTTTARTVYIHWQPVVAAGTSVNATVRIAGQTFNNINPSDGVAALDDVGVILPVAVNATQAANITQSSDALLGYIRVQVTLGDDTATGYMPTAAAAATPSGGGGLTWTLVHQLANAPTHGEFSFTLETALTDNDELYIEWRAPNSRSPHTGEFYGYATIYGRVLNSISLNNDTNMVSNLLTITSTATNTIARQSRPQIRKTNANNLSFTAYDNVLRQATDIEVYKITH